MDFKEFRKSTIKATSKRHHKIKNSLGVRDAYKWCKKNNKFDLGRKVTEKDFYLIIRTINNMMAEELISGQDIKFPQRM